MAPTASFVALKDAGEPAESTDPLFGAGVPDFGRTRIAFHRKPFTLKSFHRNVTWPQKHW